MHRPAFFDAKSFSFFLSTQPPQKKPPPLYAYKKPHNSGFFFSLLVLKNHSGGRGTTWAVAQDISALGLRELPRVDFFLALRVQFHEH